VADARLRRAGLDYHELTVLRVHRDWAACLAALRGGRAGGSAPRLHAFTTRASATLAEARFAPGDVLVFGRESAGLPDEVLDQIGAEHWLRIPMVPGCRSLNLSNAAAVAVYEAWRQQDYRGMADPAGAAG